MLLVLPGKAKLGSKWLKDRSLFIAWVGQGEDFFFGGGGITWFLGEQKGGSVVTENPKGGITENFGRIQRGTTQICLGGGDRESHQMLLGGITSVK